MQAAHNVLVDGSVEASVVQCEILLFGKVHSRKPYLRQKSALVMRDAYAEADGNIVIQREAELPAQYETDLIVKDGPSGARITGGISRALGSIQLGHAGSPDGTITRLEAGFDPDLEVRKTRLEISSPK